MNHNECLLEEEKNKIINLLRKQRKGRIIGSYGGLLADVYKKILEISENKGKCCLEDLQADQCIHSNHMKNVLATYCANLEQLGYIKIDNGEIIILKEIDF